MVYPPTESFYPALRSKYGGLAIDYRNNNWYNGIVSIFVLSAFFAAMSSIALLNPQNQTLGNYLAVSGTFAASIMITRYYKKKIKPISGKDVTIVKTLLACKAVDSFLEDGMHETKKARTKKAVNQLIADLRLWLGVKTPDFIAKPANELNAALNDKAINAIETRNLHDLELVRSALYRLLQILGENLTAELVNSVTGLLEPLPPAVKLTTTEKWGLRSKDKLRLIVRNKYIGSTMIFSIFLASAFTWYYSVPAIFINYSPDTLLSNSLNGFLVIIGLGVGAVTAYFWHSRIPAKFDRTQT